MIFVTVGTTQYPFSRLIDTVINLAKKRPQETFIIQSGAYIPNIPLPKNVTCKTYYQFFEVQRIIKRSKLIICHAGLATILQIAKAGKVPLVIPRKKEYGEHINNHETKIAQLLARKKIILWETDPVEISKYINNQKNPTEFLSTTKESAIVSMLIGWTSSLRLNTEEHLVI